MWHTLRMRITTHLLLWREWESTFLHNLSLFLFAEQFKHIRKNQSNEGFRDRFVSWAELPTPLCERWRDCGLVASRKPCSWTDVRVKFWDFGPTDWSQNLTNRLTGIFQKWSVPSCLKIKRNKTSKGFAWRGYRIFKGCRKGFAEFNWIYK